MEGRDWRHSATDGYAVSLGIVYLYGIQEILGDAEATTHCHKIKHGNNGVGCYTGYHDGNSHTLQALNGDHARCLPQASPIQQERLTSTHQPFQHHGWMDVGMLLAPVSPVWDESAARNLRRTESCPDRMPQGCTRHTAREVGGRQPACTRSEVVLPFYWRVVTTVIYEK